VGKSFGNQQRKPYSSPVALAPFGADEVKLGKKGRLNKLRINLHLLLFA
jgi:hypothetical protein